MTRQDFILRLFDNGDGLTLDQIAWIDRNAVHDMARQEEQPIEIAREVFLDNLHDCEDMLALRAELNRVIPKGQVTDMQTFRLWYAIGRA